MSIESFFVAFGFALCAPAVIAQAPVEEVQCTDNQRWEQHQWIHLSKAERDAWFLLGWTEVAWDNYYVPPPTPAPPPTPPPSPFDPTTTTTTRYRPPAVTACFEDLQQDRQDAVRQLGYTIETWITCQNVTCGPPYAPWPTPLSVYGPPPNAPCLQQFSYLEEKYNYNQAWTSLSPATRIALERLGWSSQRWSDVNIPSPYSLKWNQMVVREQEGAIFLGYNREVWEGCESSQPPTSCLVLLKRLEDKMSTWVWDDLPSGIRERLQDVGWDYRSWFENERPEAYWYKWRNLTYYDDAVGRQSALPMTQVARLLGYTRGVWDGCPSAPCQERYDYVQAKFANPPVHWWNLKKAQQRAWLLLEHNSEQWEANVMPRTFQLRWMELTFEQRQQGEYLGYSKGAWEGCNDNWTSGMTVTGNGISAWMGRTVNARMTIMRSYTEISGNVYGTEVSTMPRSFIRQFEEGVARALFCGNPPLSPAMSTFINPMTGEPLCTLLANYEQQRHRIRVISVSEGSIIVDFQIIKNVTMLEDKSPDLLAMLSRQLENLQSPICNDFYFGRYARAASVIEIAPLVVAADYSAEEALRAAWDATNACNLMQSSRDPTIVCPTAAAYRAAGPLLLTGLLTAVIAASFSDS